MSSSDQLREGYAAIKQGDTKRANTLLKQLLKEDPQNYKAWLGLARIAPTPAESLDCVRRAEHIQSADPMVQKARVWAENRVKSEPFVSEPFNMEDETEVGSGAKSSRKMVMGGCAVIGIFLLVCLGAFTFAPSLQHLLQTEPPVIVQNQTLLVAAGIPEEGNLTETAVSTPTN